MSPPVAERTLTAESTDGVRFTLVLRITAPRPASDDSWICASSIEGLWPPMDTHGADSLQALLLALQTVRGQLMQFVKSGGKLYLPGDEDSGPMSVAEVFSDGV
jgi:hypothetical protein